MAAPTTRHLTQLLSLTTPAAPVIPPVPSVPRVITDPYRLSLSVTHADGRITRWGPDELAAQDVPTGLSFGTSIPGGFKDMTCSLLRRIDVDYSDEALFDSVRVYGPGNETAWEGRVAQLPRQHADEFSVQPGAVGWVAHLEDDPSFREIYVDRDLTRWAGPSVQRRIDAAVGGISFQDSQVVPDLSTGQPALETALVANWGINTTSEALYDAQGIDIGSIYYGWKKTNVDANPNWEFDVSLWIADTLIAGESSTNLNAAGPGSGSFAAAGSGRKFAVARLAWGGGASATTEGVRYSVWWTNLTIVGSHGLSLHGPSNNDLGVYGGDAVANIVARAAPLLTYSTGSGGSIADTSFAIPQLAITDPIAASDAIQLVNGYHLYEWGVYDGREFFWRPPDPDRLTWEARLSDGAQVSLEGDDANNLFNGVLVSYTDPSGKRKTVGPPGSVANDTSSTLVDTDPDNPVNAHAIPRRWGKLDISNTTTTAGAIQLGAVWLAEHRLPTRRGQLTLRGLVQHPTEGQRPAWAVRAGDYIRIADRPGDPVRRIIETNYDHDSRTLTASLDQTVFKIEALMERMGVSLVGVI